MTKFPMPKISLAAFSGVAVLMLVASAATPADAAIGRSKFRATPEELRRHCWRIDETFWISKRRYGCGDIACTSGKCRILVVETPPPPPPPPSTVPIPRRGDGSNGKADNGGDGGHSAGGKKSGGNGGSSGAVGAAN
ncbi:hypothetical protein [Taklimakanibacter lacteus]|uniref:hypothetical protein n=1 Tax=Taklimakanibacter lacteus TaxID=2268456 RepID=UPI000E670CDF